MVDWGWKEQALPGYVQSQVTSNPSEQAREGQLRITLVPTFGLPTLIHTRATAKWLYELSNTNPVWIHPEDAAKIGVETTDLLKVKTRIGHYVNRVWVTEAIRPGVIACSHHLGRWRFHDEHGVDKTASAKVVWEEVEKGVIRVRRIEGIHAYESPDPDSKRVWWSDGGVHQNLTFPVQPDPVSGQHCWHQSVTIEKAGPDDFQGDVVVDTNKSMEVYREWLAKTKPAPGPGGLRRPLWMDRVIRPDEESFRIPDWEKSGLQ
jgi:anaerobic selenocysteine-containing dehydrogenase